ncbi:MAG TPA: hypothetical protein VIW64_04225 [Pyrinomonadaceae bacterium]|jgi:hypothetical protein
MKKRLICLLLLVMTMAASAPAQNQKQKTHPNFSGGWQVDLSNLDAGEISSEPRILLIEHQEPELRIKGRQIGGNPVLSNEIILFTDGRGETNRALVGYAIGDLKSKTEWKGEKLIRRYTTRQTVRGTFVNVNVTEELKLTDDAKKLVRTFRYTIPRAAETTVRTSIPPLVIERIYTRVQ